MGIKNFVKWINRFAPTGLNLINFNDMRNKVLGIDASILIYRSELAIKGSGFEMRNKKGNITSHLYVFFFMTINLLENNIKPIYVFDGPNYVKLKDKTMKGRRDQIKSYKNQIKTIKENKISISKEVLNKLELKTFSVTDKMYYDLLKLLSLMNIPYIEAEGEADSLLAYMNINHYIDGVISEDTDISIFGAPNLYKNVFRNMKTKQKKIEHIQYENILKELKWDREQLIIMAILLGCDYAPRIKNIGMVGATEIINSGKKILVEDKDDAKTYNDAKQFFLTDGFVQSDQIIKKLYKNYRNMIDININMNKERRLKLYNFLVKENGINKDRIIKGLNRLDRLESIQGKE